MNRSTQILKLLLPSAIILSLFATLANNRAFIIPTFDPSSRIEDDSTKLKLKYPIKDRRGDFTTGQPKNPFDLNDPTIITKDVDYDRDRNQFIIQERIGDQFFRNPAYMSLEDYLEQQFSEDENNYWIQRSRADNLLNNQNEPELAPGGRLKNRLFGGESVDIRPQGNIELTFGGDFQKTDNPQLTDKQRKTGSFNFDMNINISVIGKIGDKLKLTTSYNTQASFDFENQMKLEYSGTEDEIIKKIEAGNVSLPLSTSLIQGSQSLFGIKTQLQFGRLTVTSLISQQKAKAEELTIENGAQTQTFEVSADQYDANRHYFLSHFFRNRYNQALSTLPIIQSPFFINQMQQRIQGTLWRLWTWGNLTG
ncbi:MAG: cell surface protein SprA [Bacteroidetes bacterium]|nr:cell surface protein SprA [Bacteroidota bacterium]